MVVKTWFCVGVMSYLTRLVFADQSGQQWVQWGFPPKRFLEFPKWTTFWRLFASSLLSESLLRFFSYDVLEIRKTAPENNIDKIKISSRRFLNRQRRGQLIKIEKESWCFLVYPAHNLMWFPLGCLEATVILLSSIFIFPLVLPSKKFISEVSFVQSRTLWQKCWPKKI